MPEKHKSEPTSKELADAVDAVLSLSRQLARRRAEISDMIALTGTEITVIDQIHHHPGISPTAIAANTGLKRSNVSTALRQLEGREMITRQQAEDNDRSIEIYPTALAKKNLQRLRAAWAEKLGEAPPALAAELVRATPTIQKLSGFYTAQND